jgi:hypothetical protein
MNLIANALKEIIEDQGLLYFRTININDLNQQVGTKDVSQGIGVYSSLPEIDYNTFGASSNVLMNYNIEVYYLKLNYNTDDKGEEIDVLLDELQPMAEQLLDRLQKSGIVASGQYIDGYSLNATESLKMTKEVLTGWSVTMTIPMWRNDFYCSSIEIGTLVDSNGDILIDLDNDKLIG